MKIKNGDVIDFIALEWREPQWEFDHPTVILKPCFDYSPTRNSMWGLIEDMAIEFCCDEDLQDADYKAEFKWRGWSIKTMNTVATNRLKDIEDWKSKGARVLKQKIKFNEIEGDMQFHILESIEK